LDPLVGTRDRKAWLEQLRHLPKEKLQSPRINRVVEIVVHIMDQYPGESIVVFSQFPSLLDILGLILTEHAAIISHGFNVMRYDSDVALSKRQDVVERFNQEKNKTVLLMTSESSSHGLNLQNAAHVVQTEPWWNRDHEYQAYHRLYRQGDTKNVHVWRIFGANSTIDYLIRGIADGEHARNESILEKLTVAYDQFPEIPHQFKGGVGE
jgi:SNF2 family DNA or RNA helicase